MKSIVSVACFPLFIASLMANGHAQSQSAIDQDAWTQRGGTRLNYSVGFDAPEKSARNNWKFEMDASDSETLVQDDRVYSTFRTHDDAGEEAYGVVCLERDTGKPVWTQRLTESKSDSQDISDRYPVRPLATPILVDHRLIAVGYGGRVWCLESASGKEVWSWDLVRDFGAEPIQYGFATSPWSDGEQVIVACGGAQALVLSFDLKTGKVRWKSGSGRASYTSFVPMRLYADKQHLIYAAGDELVAIDTNQGQIDWRLAYPTTGLTNSVTPIAVDENKLLVAGQGFGGTRLLQFNRLADGGLESSEIWKSAKAQPFYCNWAQLESDRSRVVGFANKTLFVLDWKSGKVLSQTRGWTDSNVTVFRDGVLAVRGDGFLGKLRLEEDQFKLVAGAWPLRDRVWSAPVITSNDIFVRGRHSLVRCSWSDLSAEIGLPKGSEVTSMDAMYGSPPEAIELLLQKAKSTEKEFTWEDYWTVASDGAVTLSENHYKVVMDSVTNSKRWDLAVKIATDWTKREPRSIVAHERFIQSLRNAGSLDQASQLEQERLVSVDFAIQSDADTQELYVSGNTIHLGDWNPQGLRLERDAEGIWRGTARVPKGELQYKVTAGSWERAETTRDGRSLSNRRSNVTGAKTIQARVLAIAPAKK